jgi:O-antigen/teichoic acid export membrane protein
MPVATSQPSGALARRYVLVSWGSQGLAIVFGLLLPCFLAPGDYGLLFQLRQVHLFGVYAFAFILHGAVLELSLARGRRDQSREDAVREASLYSVLAVSGAVAFAGAAVGVLVAPWVERELSAGIAAFAIALPAIAVASWCNRVLLTARRFDLLWRLVLIQAPVVAAATLAGAVAYGFVGALAGLLLGNLAAALFGLRLCRAKGLVRTRRDWKTLRSLIAIGVPQSILGLAGVALRVLDRNFAYLAYGEDLGGAFALAATFSLHLLFLTQVIPDAARPTINEECGRDGSRARGTRFRSRTLGVFGLALAVAGIAYFFLPLLYPALFPRYLERYAHGADLARASLFAACPLALAYFAQLYLVATRRPALYLVAPLSAVALAVAGNAAAVAMDWGLFGIVGATGCAYLVFAVVSMLQASVYYPALRKKCISCSWRALFLSAGVLALVGMLEVGGGAVAVWLELPSPWQTLPGGVVFSALAAFALHRSYRLVHN